VFFDSSESTEDLENVQVTDPHQPATVRTKCRPSTVRLGEKAFSHTPATGLDGAASDLGGGNFRDKAVRSQPLRAHQPDIFLRSGFKISQRSWSSLGIFSAMSVALGHFVHSLVSYDIESI
jgi:hypothetical protein